MLKLSVGQTTLKRCDGMLYCSASRELHAMITEENISGGIGTRVRVDHGLALKPLGEKMVDREENQLTSCQPVHHLERTSNNGSPTDFVSHLCQYQAPANQLL